MKILFITSSYYPWHNANSKCVSKIAEELANEHSVYVLCIGNLEDKNINGVNVRYVKDEVKCREDKIATDNKVLLIFYKVFRLLSVVFSLHSYERYKVSLYKKQLKKHYNNIDVVIPVCFPIESIIAAVDVYKNSNIKILPYLFDKYLFSKTIHRHFILQKLKHYTNRLLELNLLSSSDLFFVDESWKKHISNEYPNITDKSVFVEHPLVYERGEEQPESDLFVYTGALSRKVRSPKFTLATLDLLIKESSNSIFIEFYTTGDCNMELNSMQNRHRAHFINKGRVESDIADKAVNNAGTLIIVGNSDITQTQSKVYEYISSGKKIIYFCKSTSDPVYKDLVNYPLCHVIYEEKKIVSQLDELRRFLSLPNMTIPFSEIDKQYIRYTPKYVTQQFLNGFKYVQK